MKFDKPPYTVNKKKEPFTRKNQLATERLPTLIISAVRQLNDPFYYDEVSLSIFTEQFLDFFIEESYKKVMRKRENSTTKIKILKDIVLLLETDRVVFKFHNKLVLRYLKQ
jgi:hypothetical protein